MRTSRCCATRRSRRCACVRTAATSTARSDAVDTAGRSWRASNQPVGSMRWTAIRRRSRPDARSRTRVLRSCTAASPGCARVLASHGVERGRRRAARPRRVVAAARRRPSAVSAFGPTGRSTCGWTPATGESAAQWLARAAEREIGEVIRDYGEERFAKQIAAAIVAARARGASSHHPRTCRDRGSGRPHARTSPGSGDAYVSGSTDSRQSGARGVVASAAAASICLRLAAGSW